MTQLLIEEPGVHECLSGVIEWRVQVRNKKEPVKPGEKRWDCRYFTDDYEAIRTFLWYIVNGREAYISVKEYHPPIPGYETVGYYLWRKEEDLEWLLDGPQTLGKPSEHWEMLIAKAKRALGLLDNTQIIASVIDGIPEGPASTTLSFCIFDIPDDWEIELHEDLVIALDKINRPWKYEAGRARGANIYWSARHSLYKRLWGWHRFHHRGSDNGAWMQKSQIADLREHVEITDEQLEKAIIGFKKGPSGNPIKSRLPIHANKWWAQLFGFYFSSGASNSRLRKGRYEEALLRIRAHEDVVPMVMRAARAVGSEAKVQGYVPVYTKGHATGLGTTVKPVVLLSRPIRLVLLKFGLPTEYEDDAEKIKLRGRSASSSSHPVIPSWIKDSECMHAFVEAFINGSKGQSQMGRSRLARYGRWTRTRSWLAMGVLIRMTGWPREYVIQFIKEIQHWFESHGVSGYFRELHRYDDRIVYSFKYEFAIHGMKGWKWILENFEIVRPDLRARLFSRIAAIDDPVLYECLLALETPDNVVLGLLFEQPRTRDEISTSLQMKDEGVANSLKGLQIRGMVTRRGDRYFYDPDTFIERFIKDNEERAEALASKMTRYAVKLLFQCSDCKRVYVNLRETCGLCGAEVNPVERRPIIRSLDKRRSLSKKLAYEVTA